MKKYLMGVVTAFLCVAHSTAFAALADLSASVSASPSTAIINQPLTANVAISNTGSSVLTLASLQLTSTYNGTPGGRVPAAYSYYVPNSVALAANSTTSVPVTAVFFAPSTGVTGSGTGKYFIGAVFSTTDGAVTGAVTAAQVTINPVPLPAYERQ